MERSRSTMHPGCGAREPGAVQPVVALGRHMRDGIGTDVVDGGPHICASRGHLTQNRGVQPTAEIR